MTNVGVVGNREGWSYQEIEEVLDNFIIPGDVLISGGARGVDSFVETYAMERSLEIQINLPRNDIPIPQNYFERNKRIAEECDYLIAFDKPGRSGTKNTIRFAKEFDKDVFIFTKGDEE